MAPRDMQEYQRVQNEHPEVVAGAGTAAVLLFLHIALAGYLGFAMVHLVRSAGDGVIWTPRMPWQYFFPAWLAVFTYFPTDGLTRTVGRVAAVAGALALMTAVVVAVQGETDYLRFCGALFSAALPAAALAEFFRVSLPKAAQSKVTDTSTQRLALGYFAAALSTLVLLSRGTEMVIWIFAAVGFGAVLWRAASELRLRRHSA